MTYPPSGQPGPYAPPFHQPPTGQPAPYGQPARYGTQMPQARMAQVQCQFCAYQNAAGTPKCTNCGGPLPAGQQPQTDVAAYSQSIAYDSFQRQPQPEPPGKKIATTTTAIAALAAITILASYGKYFFVHIPYELLACLLICGSIALMTRRRFGIHLIQFCAGLAIFLGILGTVGMEPGLNALQFHDWLKDLYFIPDGPMYFIRGLVGLASLGFLVATMALSANKGNKLWIASKSQAGSADRR